MSSAKWWPFCLALMAKLEPSLDSQQGSPSMETYFSNRLPEFQLFQKNLHKFQYFCAEIIENDNFRILAKNFRKISIIDKNFHNKLECSASNGNRYPRYPGQTHEMTTIPIGIDVGRGSVIWIDQHAIFYGILSKWFVSKCAETWQCGEQTHGLMDEQVHVFLCLPQLRTG